MGKLFLLSVCLLLSGSSQETQEAEEKTGVYSEDIDPRLGRLLDSVEGLQGQYRACQEERKKSSSSQNFDMGGCLWNGKGQIAPLGQDVRDEVMNKLSKGSEEGSSDDPKASRYEGVGLVNFKTKEDKVEQRLRDYLSERLKKVLFDDEKEGAKVVRDHKIWHDLYSSQLGRNILHTTSSFCLSSKALPVYQKRGDNCVISSNKWFDYRPNDENLHKENIESLGNPTHWPSQGQEAQGNGEGQEETQEQVPSGFVHFSQCLSSLVAICAKEGFYNASKNAYADGECQDKVHTRITEGQTFKQSCVAVDYLKASRQMLIDLKNVDKGWQRLKKERPGGLRVASKQRNEVEGGLVNKVVNVSSGEIFEGELEDSKDNSTWQEVADEHAENLKKCRESSDAEDEECASLFIDKEQNFKMLDEYSLRRYAMSAKIGRDLSNDENNENLKAMLLENGVSEERIEEILNSDEGQIEIIKARIARRSLHERDALIAAMRDKFNRRTLFEADQAESKIARLEEESRKRPLHYAQAVHYSNVVSAYISLREGDKRVGRNTAALAAELEQSVFDTSRRPAGDGQAADWQGPYFENLKEAGQKAIDEGGGGQGDYQFGSIDVDTINTLLRYLPQAEEATED